METLPYENPLLGVRLNYPSTWHKEENVSGAVVAFSPVADDNETSPSLNLVVQDLASSPFSLEDFTNMSLSHIHQVLPEVNDMSVSEHTLAGAPGKIVSYHTIIQGTKMKFTQVYTIKDDMAYIITLATPLGIHEKFTSVFVKCTATFQTFPKKGVGSVCLSPFLNKAYSYFVRVPKGWDRKEYRSGAVQQFELSNERAHLTLIVSIDYFPQNSLETFSNVMRAQIEQSTSARPLVVEDTTLAGVPARSVSFHTRSTRMPGRYRQVWAVQNQFAGVITLVHNIEESEPEQDEFLPIFERVVESFVFVKPDHVLDPSLRYENLTLRFSVNFPERFAPQEGFMGATVTFVVPEDIGTQAFGTNISVVVQRMHKQSLEDFCSTIKQQLESTVGGIETHKEVPVLVAGFPGRESHYSGMIEQQAVRFVQRVAIANENTVILSFAAERDKFGKECWTVGKYLDTFKFF